MVCIQDLKAVFAFDVGRDEDRDGLPNWWERQNGYDPANHEDPPSTRDSDADEIADTDEYWQQTNPRGTTPPGLLHMVVLSGEGQVALPDRFVKDALKLRVEGNGGLPLVNVPVRFRSLGKVGGKLAATRKGPKSTELVMVTNSAGEVVVEYAVPSGEVHMQSWVTASCEIAAADKSALFGFITNYEIGPPPATNLKVTEDAGTTRVTWDWESKDTGLVNFEVERSTGPDDWAVIATLPPTARSYIDSDVPPAGKVFFYRITTN